MLPISPGANDFKDPEHNWPSEDLQQRRHMKTKNYIQIHAAQLNYLCFVLVLALVLVSSPILETGLALARINIFFYILASDDVDTSTITQFGLRYTMELPGCSTVTTSHQVENIHK